MVASQGSFGQVKKNTLNCIQKGNKTCVIKTKHKGKPKKQVIPVIFVPGIFASRLEKPDKIKVWDPDNPFNMMTTLTKGKKISELLDSVTKSKANWSDIQMEQQITLLTGSAKVMNQPGTPISDKTDQKEKVEEIYLNSGVFKSILDRNKLAPYDKRFITGINVLKRLKERNKNNKLVKKLAAELHEVRRERGWYTVLGAYFDIMEKMELKDHDEFYFPAYGFGYDWRQDISDSADKFKKRIDDIVTVKEYPEYGELGKDYDIEPSNKVIIVTHSMGSIVTRYASEISGAKENIHGVMHLNQPTTGAPLLFRRFLMGTDVEKVPFSICSLKQTVGDNVLNEILGTTSYHFTKLVGSMPGPGPLELLPTNQHRIDNSLIDDPDDVVHKNNWLDIKHNCLKPLKANNTLDIYDDVYKNERIGLLACKRYNSDGQLNPYTKEEFTRVAMTPNDPSDPEMDKLKSEVVGLDYSGLYSVDEYEPKTSPYSEDSYRLLKETNSNESNTEVMDTMEKRGFKRKLFKLIDKSKLFHDALQLRKHALTTVAGSYGKDTVLKIEMTLTADNVLEMPFIVTSDGDGTVPHTSQIALLSTNADLVTGGLIQGDIGHAEIPENDLALKQVEQFLSEITNELSKTNVAS